MNNENDFNNIDLPSLKNDNNLNDSKENHSLTDISTDTQKNEEIENQESSGKKLAKAGLNVASTYFGATANANEIKSKMPSQLQGVVEGATDVAGKIIDDNPILSKAADELEEASDMVNHAANAVSDLKKGDIGGTLKEASKAGTSASEFGKKILKQNKKAIIIAVSNLCGILLFFILIIIIISPILGAILDITNGINNRKDNNTNISVGVDPGDLSNISDARKKMITLASSAVGLPYVYGRDATSPTLDGIMDGTDCSGFVGWVIWGTFGDDLKYLTTKTISSGIGSQFILINENELKPGDIGLVNIGGDSNHTGIYAGDGFWYNALGAKWGIVKNQYKNFHYYLRYYKIPEGL